MESLVGAERMATNRRLFKEALKRGEDAFQKGDLQAVIAWSKVAAHFAFARHCGFYSSPELENLLLNLAQRIENQPPDVSGTFYLKNKPENYGKMRFLHVITEGYDTGGHCPFIARWIQNTTDKAVHSLIATSQTGSIPQILLDAVAQSGGWFCALTELTEDLIEQALLLRLLANSWTDVVVLLVHPFDPLPTVAFGVNGGPPVILCNHADHAFWLGNSISDVIVDYHQSGGVLSAKRRGKSESKILPIPLSIDNRDSVTVSRKELGFNADDIILLTVGREEKFLPIGDVDFLNVMVKFLETHRNVRLIAVGPSLRGKWRAASEAVGNRITALGTLDRSTLEKYLLIADIYVAGFPCGSGTSMLEAGLHGLPIVGLRLEELPYISMDDDVAFLSFNTHLPTTQAFSAYLDVMINDLSGCRQKAEEVRESIKRTHCPPGWNNYLDVVLQSLPSQHITRKPDTLIDEVDDSDYYFERVSSAMLSNEAPEASLNRLMRVYSSNLPKTTILLLQAKNLLRAFPKVNSLTGLRQYLLSIREFCNGIV